MNTGINKWMKNDTNKKTDIHVCKWRQSGKTALFYQQILYNKRESKVKTKFWKISRIVKFVMILKAPCIRVLIHYF